MAQKTQNDENGKQLMQKATFDPNVCIINVLSTT